MRIMPVLFAMVTAAPAYADGFAIDMSIREIRTLNEYISLADLRVGDIAITYDDFCLDGINLQISGQMQVVEREEKTLQLQVRRLPGDMVSVKYLPATKKWDGTTLYKPKKIEEIVKTTFSAGVKSCDFITLISSEYVDHEYHGFFVVNTLNGMNSLSEILAE